jgi:hypothetical protein
MEAVSMNGRAILAAAMLLVSVPTFGQSLKPDWIADARTGCKVWDRDPHPKESITWSGACRNGKVEGHGSLDWFRDGKLAFHFDGTLWGGKVSGRGVETFSNGNRIVGVFRDGNANGHGVFTFASGGRFDGQFRDGKPNGHGVYSFASGDRYDGQWRDGKANGHGVKTFLGGDRYVGEWKDDKMNGRGNYTLADGTRFDGAFLDGLPNGHGKAVWPNGIRFDGMWVEGCYRDGDRFAAFGVEESSCR